MANGIDPRDVETRRVEEEPRARDHLPSYLVDHDEIARELLRLATDVGVRLRKAAVVARTVTLKLRYGDFDRDALAHAGRADGCRAPHLRGGARAPRRARRRRPPGAPDRRARRAPAAHGRRRTPLWDPDEDWRDAERTVDEVVRKFGRGAVRPAALVRPGGAGALPTAGTGWERDEPEAEAEAARAARASGRMARCRQGTRLLVTRRAASSVKGLSTTPVARVAWRHG